MELDCLPREGDDFTYKGTVDDSDYLDYGEFVETMIHLQTLSSEEHLITVT